MAKANGIIKIEGTVEDLTFYRQDGKNFVRRKGGISKERIEVNMHMTFAQKIGRFHILNHSSVQNIFKNFTQCAV